MRDAMTPLFGFTLGPQEIIILLALGVLLFGRKLPEVGRYLGKGIVEFKKGIKGLEDDVDTSSAARQEPILEQPRPPQRVATTAPKFEDSPNPASPPNA
jgi:sec-independent protein translocase protein TatA